MFLREGGSIGIFFREGGSIGMGGPLTWGGGGGKASGYFLFFPGYLLMVAIITGRGPRYTQNFCTARAPRTYRGKSVFCGV